MGLSTALVRTQRKIREARKLAAGAAEAAPDELADDLADAVACLWRAEEKTAELLRKGIRPKGAP